ncbi:hypothetical protein WCQ02_06565 [Paraburkholderia tropica]|uniref:hypothetical protein n=1 Tax=Paraburkholderia tropica TaxID=92647 RepID=UPI00301703BB
MLNDAEVEYVLNEVKLRSLAKASITLPGDWLQKRAQQTHSTTVKSWTSGVAFSFTAPPSFWRNDDPPYGGPLEKRYAYCLLVEVEIDHTVYLFIQRLNAPSPVEAVRNCAKPPRPPITPDPLKPWQFLAPWIEENTRIERLSMRPMALVETALRRKVLEARDVKTVLSTLGIQTTVPGSIQIFGAEAKTRKLGLNGRFRLLPKLQKIAEQSGRLNLTELEKWIVKVTSAFHGKSSASGPPTDLFQAFAQPVDTLAGEKADSLLIDCQAIWNRLEEKRIVFENSSQGRLRKHDFLDVLDEPIKLAAKKLASGSVSSSNFEGKFTKGFKGRSVSAVLSVFKASVGCTISELDNIFVFDEQEYGNRRLPLSDYISRERLFRVAFAGGKKIFAAEGVFTEADPAKSSAQLLKIFSPINGAEKVTSEKGKPGKMSTGFPVNSSFAMLVDALSRSNAMVCDDSKKEWCDFLALKPPSATSGAEVSWLHAKVKGTLSGGTTSASNLQDVIGQAVKNLGRLRLSRKVVTSAKRNVAWAGKYVFPETNVTTGIDCFMPHARIGTLPAFIDQLDEAASDPRTRYRVCIVVPTLSRDHITKEFAKLGTSAAAPEVVQLFWILSGFMQSCLEVHAQPVVRCRR